MPWTFDTAAVAGWLQDRAAKSTVERIKERLIRIGCRQTLNNIRVHLRP